MADDDIRPRDRALDVVRELPENASVREILFAIHQQSELDDAISTEKIIHEARAIEQDGGTWSGIVDTLGCLLPLLAIPGFFLLMPVLFALGERIVSPPVREIDNGPIESIRLLEDTDAANYVGKPCRVLGDHLKIETERGVVYIPNAHYQEVRIRKSR